MESTFHKMSLVRHIPETGLTWFEVAGLARLARGSGRCVLSGGFDYKWSEVGIDVVWRCTHVLRTLWS